MVKSIGRVYHWATPTTIDALYFDDHDYHGLVYWYNDAIEYNEEIEKSSKK